MMQSCARILLMVLVGVLASYSFAEDAADALDGAVSIKSQEAVGHVPVVETNVAVPWAVAPVRIDGDLAEWDKNRPAVLLEGKDHASWYRGSYGGKDDLSASVWLCRDDRNLYLAMQIADDQLPVADRITVAFADAKSPLVLGWRDVGQRYGSDDVHIVFVLGKDGNVAMHWAHVQERMDYGLVQNSFGTEAERRVHVEEGSAAPGLNARIFAKASRQLDGGKSVTTFEAAFPWKNLAPYVPVSYSPLKFNVAVEDRDDRAGGQASGGVAWKPGLMGTYSAAHIANQTFEPRVSQKAVEGYAQLPTFNYINQNIVAGFTFYNPGAARSGELQLLAAGDEQKPLATTKVSLPTGVSRKDVAVHSEKVGPGRKTLVGRLVLTGEAPLDIPVMVPSADDKVAVQAVAEFEARIASLERNAAALGELYERVKAQGLDSAYPLAYLTLQKMFIPRCRGDLKAGDSARVLKNTDFLEKLYASSKAYMEEILARPKAQLKVPPRFDPDKLTMKNGYYFDGDRPVFLWGPCTFWYLRQDQPLVIGLGFNSVCPEAPQDRNNNEVLAHMETWARAGVSMNASMNVPGLQLTGADANRSALLKEHPEMKNLFPNNFLPFVIQHPAARQAIVEGYKKSVDFWKPIEGVRSYWLWNEPWYLNYSEMTRQDFIQHLATKYKTVEALNKRWKSQYASFSEIKLIEWPDPDNYAPWYDFQQFRDTLLVDFFGFLNRTSKELDSRRPTHTKFMAASLHSFNIEKLQSVYDIAGHDGSISDRDIPFLDFCRSVYPDHPLVNTEIHIAYAGKKAVEMVPWRLALHGLADGNWWCWHSNQRFSDSLANAESMYALSIPGLDIQRLFYPYIFALNQKATSVATLFPDVIERRSDVKMVRIRFEIAAAQYGLGLRPFYATETRIAGGELANCKLLLAGESDYVKQSTYQGVLDYVKRGGRAIVTRGGFAHNEYGDARDASELIRMNGGAEYGEGARIYPVGQGQVICIDAIENMPDVVIDGGQCLRGGPLPENEGRRRVYQRVLAKAMADLGLNDAVRLVARQGAEGDPLYGLDWRSVEVDGGYTLAVLPYDSRPPFNVKLSTAKPVRKIVNLITGKEVDPTAFELQDGPNLLRIELEK